MISVGFLFGKCGVIKREISEFDTQFARLTKFDTQFASLSEFDTRTANCFSLSVSHLFSQISLFYIFFSVSRPGEKTEIPMPSQALGARAHAQPEHGQGAQAGLRRATARRRPAQGQRAARAAGAAAGWRRSLSAVVAGLGTTAAAVAAFLPCRGPRLPGRGQRSASAAGGRCAASAARGVRRVQQGGRRVRSSSCREEGR